jgi:hypothetical protein
MEDKVPAPLVCNEIGSYEVVRPPRIELGLRVPETLVISFSLRAR